MQRNFTQSSLSNIKKHWLQGHILVANAFVFGQKISPSPTLRFNINSPNFFITNFNDMKRMNLIRAALFAVCAFMGTISLSAQQNWLPPAEAIVVLNNELDKLTEKPVPVPTASISSKQLLVEQNAKSGGVGCSDCMVRSVKEQFLMLTLLRIKEGMDTGPAVLEVRALLISNANNNPTLLSAIQTAYLYMQQKLG